MKIYSEYTRITEYNTYLSAIELLEQNENRLDEALSNLTGKLKKYYNFIKELAERAKIGIQDIVSVLKNRQAFNFFKKIKFSMQNFFNIVKKGFRYYREVKNAIAEYIAATGLAKWTEGKLKGLDEFLKKHPKLKRVTGIAVGAILLYIWLNMSFTGDFDYDFDQSTLIGALAGNFTLSDIFAGPEGIKLLTLFFTGSVLSFPWPGPQSALLITSMLYGLAKTYNIKDVLSKLKTRGRT